MGGQTRQLWSTDVRAVVMLLRSLKLPLMLELTGPHISWAYAHSDTELSRLGEAIAGGSDRTYRDVGIWCQYSKLDHVVITRMASVSAQAIPLIVEDW